MHQVITSSSADVELSSVKSFSWQEMLKILITKTCLNIAHLKFLSHFPTVTAYVLMFDILIQWLVPKRCYDSTNPSPLPMLTYDK